MPTRKQDARLRERHFGMTTLFTLAFLICVAFVWRTPSLWPAAIGCGAIVLAGLVFQELRFRRYHCPDCGALLPFAEPGIVDLVTTLVVWWMLPMAAATPSATATAISVSTRSARELSLERRPSSVNDWPGQMGRAL